MWSRTNSIIAIAALGLGAGAAAGPAQPLMRAVAAGSDHACALTRAGDAYCWGGNELGQLGRGTADSIPGSVPGLVRGRLKFEAIAAGFAHTCGITAAGEAYCWGSNEYGQLGDGTRIGRAEPVRVSGGIRFRAVGPGGTHTCAVDHQSVAYCWGGNWHGQLGLGNREGEPASPCCVTAPVPVRTDLAFSSAAAGGIHSCAVTAEGRAYCWGSPQDGRLGSGAADARDPGADKTVPAAVAGTVRFSNITPRSWHTCGLSESGLPYCWGAGGLQGILGNVGAPGTAVPALVAGLDGVATVAAGLQHNCALTTVGDAYCWGANTSGQVGDGTTRDARAPTRLATEHRFSSIAVGGNLATTGTLRAWSFSCAVKRDQREVHCWGDNRRGQLGNGSTTSSSLPVRVVWPAGH
jgi:alpha-tubulin suppressor-like RCC1 family protein